MKEKDSIYVDAGLAANLRCGGAATPCPNLEEAVIAWSTLPEEEQKRATISLPGRRIVYKPEDIRRLRLRY